MLKSQPAGIYVDLVKLNAVTPKLAEHLWGRLINLLEAGVSETACQGVISKTVTTSRGGSTRYQFAIYLAETFYIFLFALIN